MCVRIFWIALNDGCVSVYILDIFLKSFHSLSAAVSLCFSVLMLYPFFETLEHLQQFPKISGGQSSAAIDALNILKNLGKSEAEQAPKTGVDMLDELDKQKNEGSSGWLSKKGLEQSRKCAAPARVRAPPRMRQ